MLNINQIYNADCLEILKEIPDNSIDSVVTDPPYQLGFMGKSWDKEGITYNVDLWKECLRILKPGGHLLAFGGTRTYHRLACAIEDAGFEIRDQIQWLYSTGFPKSLDISKAIDKIAEKNENVINAKIECGKWLKENRKKLGLSIKDIAKHFPSKTKGLTGCVSNWENGKIPTWKHFSKLKEILKLDNSFDYLIKDRPRNWIGAERGVIGKGGRTRKDSMFGIGVQKEWDLTTPATPEAQQWDGWGTRLKPANEPICLARKPISEKNIAENILKWGTGGLNIDGGRIELNGEKQPTGSGNIKHNYQGRDALSRDGSTCEFYSQVQNEGNITPSKGRFPSNVILDEKASELLDKQSGVLQSGFMKKGTRRANNPDTKNTYGERKPNEVKNDTYGDSGGASRFFYIAKASKSERNEGLEGFLKIITDDGRKRKIDNAYLRGKTTRQNNHPTVKPIKLMRYLVRLVTPSKGTVLDPFLGSGTTAIACIKEGFNYIGIEKEPDYFKIAEKQIAFYRSQPELDFENVA